MTLSLAEKRLKSLGITQPSEIDLLAIADDMGAAVKKRNLTGCEAKIIGIKDRAIISINENSNRYRQRYSLGHELGHWRMHRGKNFVCRAEDIGSNASQSEFERQADQYAADLLMPEYLAAPFLRGFGDLTAQTILSFSDEFRVSYQAAAIRVGQLHAQHGYFAMISKTGVEWSCASKNVPWNCRIGADNRLAIPFPMERQAFSFNAVPMHTWLQTPYHQDGFVDVHFVGVRDDRCVVAIPISEYMRAILWE